MLISCNLSSACAAYFHTNALDKTAFSSLLDSRVWKLMEKGSAG